MTRRIDIPPPRAPLETYMMDVMRDDWGQLLAPFAPPLPQEASVIMASYFGDVFVKGPEDEVWWLNGLEERVDRITDSKEAFEERLSTEYYLMLKTGLLEEMFDANKVLAEGRLYGLKTPRCEGGKYTPGNIGTAPIADAFAYMGALFQKKLAAAGQAETVEQTPEPQAAPAPPEKPKKKGWFS